MSTTQIGLNGENWDADSGTFILKFAHAQRFNQTQMALAKASLYNSFGNISQELGNNYFSIFWPDGETHTEYQFIIPTGFYSQEAFYEWLQSEMKARYLFVVRNNANFYPIFMGENNSYKRLLVFYPINDVAVKDENATWTLPPNGYISSPYIVWPLALGRLFGHVQTQMGDGGGLSLNVSTVVAENSINSIILTCNAINNSALSYPKNILACIPVGGVEFGHTISKISPKLEWMDIQEGYYNELVITIYDQSLKKIAIQDTNLLLMLSFKQKP